MTETEKMVAGIGAQIPRVEVMLRRTEVKSRIVGAEATSFPAVAGMFDWLADFPYEALITVSLDITNRIRHFTQVATGGSAGIAVSPAEVLRPAFLTNSHGVILIHNHPHGDPRPSRQDIEFTRRMRRACRSLGICLHEHLVIGWSGFFCRVCRQMDMGVESVVRAVLPTREFSEKWQNVS